MLTAGSERVAKTGTAGAAVKESGVINASLLTLGVGEFFKGKCCVGGVEKRHRLAVPPSIVPYLWTVISKLIAGETHIPYRDSKVRVLGGVRRR